MNFLRNPSSIFNIFWNFSDCAALYKCILPALSVIFWPKLVVFDQLANVLTGLVNGKKANQNASTVDENRLFQIDFSKLQIIKIGINIQNIHKNELTWSKITSLRPKITDKAGKYT